MATTCPTVGKLIKALKNKGEDWKWIDGDDGNSYFLRRGETFQRAERAFLNDVMSRWHKKSDIYVLAANVVPRPVWGEEMETRQRGSYNRKTNDETLAPSPPHKKTKASHTVVTKKVPHTKVAQKTTRVPRKQLPKVRKESNPDPSLRPTRGSTTSRNARSRAEARELAITSTEQGKRAEAEQKSYIKAVDVEKRTAGLEEQVRALTRQLNALKAAPVNVVAPATNVVAWLAPPDAAEYNVGDAVRCVDNTIRRVKSGPFFRPPTGLSSMGTWEYDLVIFDPVSKQFKVESTRVAQVDIVNPVVLATATMLEAHALTATDLIVEVAESVDCKKGKRSLRLWYTIVHLCIDKQSIAFPVFEEPATKDGPPQIVRKAKRRYLYSKGTVDDLKLIFRASFFSIILPLLELTLHLHVTCR